MKKDLNLLKDSLLEIKGLDTGHANVQKVIGKENIIIDENGQTYAGIADNQGNMFYIRSTKKTTFRPLSNKAIKRYKSTTPCEMVLTVRKVDVEALIQQIMPRMNKNCIMTSVNTDSPEVFKKETGIKNPTIDFSEWQIIKFEFNLISTVSSMTNCIVDLCKC